MGWIDEGVSLVLSQLNNACPVCKKYIKKGPNYLKEMKGIALKRQGIIETQIWEMLWNAAYAACSEGSGSATGSQFRKQRYICPKCGRQYTLEGNGIWVETPYSRLFRI